MCFCLGNCAMNREENGANIFYFYLLVVLDVFAVSQKYWVNSVTLHTEKNADYMWILCNLEEKT